MTKPDYEQEKSKAARAADLIEFAEAVLAIADDRRAREHQDIDSDPVLSALYAILNVEGPALAGGRMGAWEGLDVPWHFAKAREAIKARHAELRGEA